MTSTIIHTVANGFCTVCNETEEWMVQMGMQFEYVTQDTAPTQKSADDLAAGDVIRYDASNDWKIGERVQETARTVSYRFEYVRSHPCTTARGGVHTFRKSTTFALV